MSYGEKIFQVVNYIILSFIVLVCLYPMWHVAMASFSDSNQLMAQSGFLLKPLGFNLQAYVKVFQNPMILKGYANTLFILVVGVILDLIMTALAAYFFSRKDVMFKKTTDAVNPVYHVFFRRYDTLLSDLEGSAYD